MRFFLIAAFLGATIVVLAGCSTIQHSSSPTAHLPAAAAQESTLVQVACFDFPPNVPEELHASNVSGKKPTSEATMAESVGLPDLIALTLDRNPRLVQAMWAIETARGRAVQDGLYPNPTVAIRDDELGDRTGRAGIVAAPYISQEIVTGGKLQLSRAAAVREVDQATLALVSERFARLTAVRQSYFEALTLQRRLGILDELVKLASQSAETTKKLVEAKEALRLDLLQLEVDRERYRAELQATRRELPAAMLRLASSVGVPAIAWTTVAGSLENPVPDYELDKSREVLVQSHPEVRSAQVGVERARLLLQRAQAEPVPNITVGAGYLYQHENRSNDAAIGVSFPVPLWNRNQGGIAAARAYEYEALANVGRIQNDLAERLAVAFGQYSSARQRAEQYRTEILPRAREAYPLSLKGYQGGQFEYLRVLQSQRAVAEANLEYNRALGEMWHAASEIAGLMLEDTWPRPAAMPQHQIPHPLINELAVPARPEGEPIR